MSLTKVTYSMTDGAPVNAKDFGAVGDGVADDTAALEDAIAHCFATGRQLVGQGSYKITSTVNFRRIGVDFEYAGIDVAHAGIGILIGGNASDPNNPVQRFNSVIRSVGSDSTTTPTVRAIGVKGQHIHLQDTGYFQVYADTHNIGETALRNLDYSSAYSSFWIKRATTVELTNNLANAGGPANGDAGGTIQWINENRFYLDRTENLLINGTYGHNHNVFYNGTFESTNAVINWDTAVDTILYGARFEGTVNITFGATSARNIVEKSWSSSESSGGIFLPIVAGTIVDNGVQNQVYDYRGKQYSKSVIARTDVSDVVLNTAVGATANRQTNLQRVTTKSTGNDVLIETDFLPVVAGDEYRMLADLQNSGDVLRYRPAVLFYDNNLQPIADATGFVVSPTLTVVSGNVVTQGNGTDFGRARITATAAAGAVFLKAQIRSSGGQIANALARQLTIRRFSREYTSNNAKEYTQNRLPVVSAVPTQGFAQLGFTCIDSDGLSLYINTFALDTTLTGGGTTSSTSITIANGTGTTNGDIIGINLDDRTTHWTTIASGGGTTSITLTAGLPSAAANGSRVVFNRWATK